MKLLLLLLAFSSAADAQSILGPIFSVSSAPAPAPWYNTNWSNRKSITADHTKVTTTQSNFPVLVSFSSDSDVAAKAQSNGNDILFTSADGTTKLSHEIEKYTTATGLLVVWVKFPSLSSSTDTVIYLYYGNGLATNQQNATGVWDANFKGVYHFTTVTSSPDSTSTANSLTNNGATSVTGMFGSGAAFNGTNQSASTSATVDLTGNTATVEMWANLSSVAACKVMLETSTNYNITTGALIWDPDCESGGTFGTIIHGSGSNLNYNGVRFTNPSATAWHHLAMVVNLGVGAARAVTTYIDGVQATMTTSSSTDLSAVGLGNLTMYFMSRANASSFQGGTLDEVRVSNTSRSASWVATEYANQSSPSTFYRVGAEESQ